MALLLETIWGDLVIDLDVEGSPDLCKNILKLAKVRYYTNTLIFSVTQNRFCQAGCPVGDGTGGACIYGLTDPSVTDYRQSKQRFLRSVGRPLSQTECREKGRVVATTQNNNTPDTIGSQFLITVAGGPDHALDGYSSVVARDGESSHTTTTTTQFLSLGVVTEDENGVLDKINAAYVDPNGRPYADIRIIRALVLHDPFTDDPPGMDRLMERMGVVVVEEKSLSGRVVDSPSPVRPAEERVPKRISAADVMVDGNSEDEEELKQKLIAEREEAAQKEDKSRAVVLEMLGDLPDADIRAPEDVLFICKLNPATVDEDLELIMSRFDEKVKVEIIRDPDTGASLQYAFAEFSTKQAAVEAYFKMNNALVDDRRIKVDFSQSVAKLWDKYKQKLRMPTHLTDGAAGPVGGSDAAGYRRGHQGRGPGRGQQGRGTGRGQHGRGPDINENVGRGGRGSRDHANANKREHDRRREVDRDSQRRDTELDGFGRSRDFRPRTDADGRGEGEHSRNGRADDHHSGQGRDRRADSRHRSRERHELRSKDDDEDSGYDRRHKKHRNKHRKKRRRHHSDHSRRHDSSDSASDRSNKDEIQSYPHRHDDRGAARDSRSRSTGEPERQREYSRERKDRYMASDSKQKHRSRDSDDSDVASHDSGRGHRRKEESRRRRDSDRERRKSRHDRGVSVGSCESDEQRHRRRHEDGHRRHEESSDGDAGKRHNLDRKHRKRDLDKERDAKKRHVRKHSRS